MSVAFTASGTGGGPGHRTALTHPCFPLPSFLEPAVSVISMARSRWSLLSAKSDRLLACGVLEADMKNAVATTAAPQAIGPYSQAVSTGPWLFCSGQIGLDPGTGQLVPGGIDAETSRVLENLRAVLDAAGATLDCVVRTTIYLVDLGDFGRVNEIYARYFSAPFPARATVGVAALPRGARVEIDAIALREGN
jgi:2-iminobutanoate/2-iminopropanoate deaminase